MKEKTLYLAPATFTLVLESQLWFLPGGRFGLAWGSLSFLGWTCRQQPVEWAEEISMLKNRVFPFKIAPAALVCRWDTGVDA